MSGTQRLYPPRTRKRTTARKPPPPLSSQTDWGAVFRKLQEAQAAAQAEQDEAERWTLFDLASTIGQRFMYLLVCLLVVGPIGGTLFVMVRYGGNRDAMLLFYFISIGLGLSYFAIKRPLLWITSWRITRVKKGRR